jgi:hypothetical protein
MSRALFVLAGLACVGLAVIARAGVEADPGKEYVVNPQIGAWVICAATYRGDDAPELARKLVRELRSHYNLAAWVWDKGEEERQKQRDRWRQLHEQYKDAQVPLRGYHIEEQCAVLIGGYKDMDAARRELDRIKNLKPPSDKSLMHIFLRVPEDKGAPEGMVPVEGAYVSPFIRSFVTRNPTVPVERRGNPMEDPFLKTLNAEESFSLLRCTKRYTLLVGTFQGNSVYESESPKESSFLSKLTGRKPADTLGLSAMNAHNMADFLRKTQPGAFDAYVLHMRNGSLVTVGGFDSDKDPQLQATQRLLAGTKFGPNVPLLAEPIVIEIPRPK